MAAQKRARKACLFSAADDEQLIEEVRKYPNLYDTSMREYRDTERADNCWEKIEQATGKTANELRSRWRNLRDVFAKEKKKMSGRSGDPGGHTSTWKYFKLLTFLLPFIKHRDTESNVPRYVKPVEIRLTPSIKFVTEDSVTLNNSGQLKLFYIQQKIEG